MKLKFLLLLLFWALLLESQNCYTIVVGKDASKTGKVILAHNEDDYGELIVNFHKEPSHDYGKKYYYKLINGDSVRYAGKTFSYIRYEVTNQLFGDFYINEYGVAICSNACASKETDIIKPDKSNYREIKELTIDFRRMIAMRARSSREAVNIAKALIDSLGYASSGRTYVFADKYEAWIMAIVKGKIYVARHLKDNEVALIPNYYTIETIDTTDKHNWLYSPNIFSYAIQKGWYNPNDTSQTFNFRQVYGKPESLRAISNIPRHWIGAKILYDSSLTIANYFPYFFIPKQKIGFTDLKNVLTNHFENTDYEIKIVENARLHESLTHPICNYGTVYSVIIDFNDNPAKNIIWTSIKNPCMNEYLPVVFEIEDFPPYFTNSTENDWKLTHFELNYNKHANNHQHVFVLASQNTKDIEENITTKYIKNQKKLENTHEKYQKQITKDLSGRKSYEILLKYYKNLYKKYLKTK